MSEFKGVNVTVGGDVTVMLYTARPLENSTRPVVMMLHGTLRSASDMAPWGELLDDVADVVLLDFPGHGRSQPTGSPTLAAFADIVDRILKVVFSGRSVLLVGESAGGMIALENGGRTDPGGLRAVLAVDPIMTTAKQWYLARYLQNRSKETHPFLLDLWRNLFGMSEEGQEERIYYPLIGALKVPAVIVTGDIPLLPPRKLSHATCVFDDVDRFVIETAYPGKTEIRRLAGVGHLLMVDAQPQMLEIIREMLAKLMTNTSAGRDLSAGRHREAKRGV